MKALFLRRAVLLGLLWSLGGFALEAQSEAGAPPPPDAAEIVRQANRIAYYQGADGSARATLTITDAKGRVRTKELSVLRRDMGEEDKEQRLYVYFRKPADEHGTAFLVWKYLDRDDDRWLYLPALDVEKRIAAGDKRTHFVGSDFFYEDISGRNPEADHHELEKETDLYYVIRSTPREGEEVEFDAFTTWIHKESSVPVQVRYEKQGKVYREAKILGVEEIQGYRTLTKIQMKDLDRGTSTVMIYEDVKYDLGLPEDVFTQRYLRTPPLELLP